MSYFMILDMRLDSCEFRTPDSLNDFRTVGINIGFTLLNQWY